MAVLVAMSPETYAAFVKVAVADYAASCVGSGRWAAADALDLARAEFAALLPQGLQTPDHHLYEIHDGEGGTIVGFLWFAVVERGRTKAAYVFQLQIEPAFRRRGHARAAFQALERIVTDLGLASIGLHVFGANAAALALYQGLGYGVTGVNMLKTLDRNGA